MSVANPLSDNAPTDQEDQGLVMRARAGDRRALEELVQRHQGWIHNIALRMLFHPQDAEDATQEILVKVMTRLSSLEGRSSFRTWLYRTVVNHVLNMKRGRVEHESTSFAPYGAALDATPDMELADPKGETAETRALVTEAMLLCTSGMLLCLDREQRLSYILGAIFDVSDTVAAEVLEISPENFRQRLARARRDLRHFMNDKWRADVRRRPAALSRLATWIRRTSCSSVSEFARCGKPHRRRTRLSRPWTISARTSTADIRSTRRRTWRRWCGSWSRVPT
jgi:RNA polymerase sigma factor (sigma-70 family)